MKSMEFSTKSNLGLSLNEFYCLQSGEQNRTYRHLTQQVVSEIESVLKPTLRQLTPHWEDAQDLLANTLEKFWQSLPQLEYGYLNAWLINVCRNLHITDWRRTRKIELTNDWCESDFGYEPPTELETSFWDNHPEQIRILNHLLETVDEDRRATFVQNHLYNEPIQDLAKELNMPPNSLTKRHTRIMDGLRSKARRFKSCF
jgi:RNA polymerase sigma factor (sigma-70 family)